MFGSRILKKKLIKIFFIFPEMSKSHKYITQNTQYETDWHICMLSFGDNYAKELTFTTKENGHAIDFTLQDFFYFDSEKFINCLREDKNDVHIIASQCFERNDEQMIIPCFDGEIYFDDFIRESIIGMFVNNIMLLRSINFEEGYFSLAYVYDVHSNHPLIVQVFEPFWEELQIIWV